jgi:hypothetical protein
MSAVKEERGRVSRVLGGARELWPWVAAGTGAVLAIALAVALLGGGGDGGGRRQGGTTLTGAAGSWIPGQPSLVASAAYLAIANRAERMARQREAERQRLLALIEARRKAAEERKKDEARRRYEELKRRAEARYRAALRRAEALKRKRARELAAARRKRAEALRRLLAKLRVDPGEECKVPEVRRRFNCVRGRLPLAGEKR